MVWVVASAPVPVWPLELLSAEQSVQIVKKPLNTAAGAPD